MLFKECSENCTVVLLTWLLCGQATATTVMYSTVFWCTLLYGIVRYCATFGLQCAVQSIFVQYCSLLYSTMQYCRVV